MTTSPTATLNVDGTPVWIEGTGPRTLVMIHGWPDTAALWTPQVAHFSDRFRCVRFTLPGFDVNAPRRALPWRDMVAHLAAIVDAVSPGTPVTLMLHDWGAVYGYQYAMHHPTRVSRIVGIDVGDTTSAEFVRGLGWRAKASIFAYQGWLALAYLMPRPLGDAMTRWMARQFRAPAAADLIGATMNHPYVAQFGGGFKGMLAVEPRCPMLFFYGTRKPFSFHTPAWAERLAATPQCAVHGLRTGHWVMVNQRDAFHRHVDDWLATLP
jgi:pimeloyl-ACP methyl ester carboxylesterase